MPVKQKRAHHRGSKHEKHTKKFLKAYAPYLPLLFIVGFGLFLSISGTVQPANHVLSYATQMTDSGLLDATNEARRKNGLNELRYNPILDQAAQSKADDMAKRNYWSHNTPDGKEPWTFIDNSGYQYYKAAENLAYGFTTSEAAIVGWMNSPSHRANVLDRDLVEVGFGIINVENFQNKGNETVVVAMYGLPPPADDSQPIIAGVQKPSSPSLPVTAAPATSKNISYAQMLTGGYAPWISLVSALAIGLIVGYLALKHTANVSRAFRNGERFILHHPLLDTTLVALVALATIVAQTAGVIH